MKITITGRKVSLRDNFKERVEKKLKKFGRMFGEDASASVTVTVEKRRQTVEVTIRTADGMVYRSEQTAPEMNDALDEVVNALGRQIRKNKCKLEKKIRAVGAIDEFWLKRQRKLPPRRKLRAITKLSGSSTSL